MLAFGRGPPWLNFSSICEYVNSIRLFLYDDTLHTFGNLHANNAFTPPPTPRNSQLLSLLSAVLRRWFCCFLLLFHCLLLLLLSVRGSVFCPCFVMKNLEYILVIQSSWRARKSWLLYFNCLSDVFGLLMLCGFSSRCRGMVCNVVYDFTQP